MDLQEQFVDQVRDPLAQEVRHDVVLGALDVHLHDHEVVRADGPPQPVGDVDGRPRAILDEVMARSEPPPPPARPEGEA